MDKSFLFTLEKPKGARNGKRSTWPDVPWIGSTKGWIGMMDDHEMWWSLRRILYRNTMSYAETEIIRDWLQGFPKVIRILQAKTWDPEAQSIVDSFEQWYGRWWESGVFKQI